jgi:two-component system NtrC family sensor kinase
MNPVALIVDDSLTVRMDLAQAFQAAGFRPVLCASVTEARAAVADTVADLIILDVVLPDGDGIDLLAELRGRPDTAGAVILMLSTEAEVGDRIRGMQTGADEYVGKPYDTGYVIAKANELLRTNRAVEPGAPGILVIDDSQTVRKDLAAVLEAEGYAVITADSGEEGLRLAAGRRPAAVIVDGELPGIDGPTVIRRIRMDAALRGVPCLLLTAADDRGAELRALDSGADGFVRKGETTVILAKLAAALRSATGGAVEDAGSLLGPKKLLVVDDSDNPEDVLGPLRGEGYDVIQARSGNGALALLGNQPVDCVLLSSRTTDPDAAETCRRVKAAPFGRDVAVIITTEQDDPGVMVDGLAAGADDVFHESGDFEILNARIRSHIRRKLLDAENRRIREELLSRELATSQALAAQQLAETRAALTGELERRNEELEAFSYSASHDLRGPLQSMIGFNQILIEDRGDELDDEVRDCVQTTLNAAWRMAGLIDDLLQLSQAGSGELARRPVDVAMMVRETLAELRRRDPGREVTAIVAEHAFAPADARLVRILIDNLVGNAWKYTARTDRPELEFGQRPAAGGPDVFFVRDNGAGFDMAAAEELFRPFSRLHTADQFPGTGIGLATVRRIVDRHGGRIWAEAAPGEGATFFFTLSAG